MSLIDITTISMATKLAKAVVNGPKKLKLVFLGALVSILAAIIIAALVDSGLLYRYYNFLAAILGVIGGIGVLILYAYQTNADNLELKLQIKEVEDRVKENPNEPIAAWELGRIKLENYLNRNLIQVQMIFIWTVVIMIAGFSLICYGITKGFSTPINLNASILTIVSGTLIEFIGATFLVLYKSSIQQAKENINVLERINAVGMAVQILESISESETKLRDQTKAEIAKQLLSMYSLTHKLSSKKKH